jgi:hypothetical protein
MWLFPTHWQTQSRRDAPLAQMTVLARFRRECIIRSTHRCRGRSVFVSLAINLRTSKPMSPTAVCGQCVQESDSPKSFGLGDEAEMAII